jgi:NAD(P)-dependent dehydrogenase (short-subunit alcohol dehydrogenase family)
MLEQSPLKGGGVVINISSIAAVIAMGSNVMYCASKAAVDNMTKSLARALAPKIRVLSVSPGLVDTDFVKSLDQAWRDEQASRTPLKRLAQPEEIAAAVISAITQLTFVWLYRRRWWPAAGVRQKTPTRRKLKSAPKPAVRFHRSSGRHTHALSSPPVR